ACVIVEPVAANMGVVVPEPGFLQRLRTLTSRHGILLIFDEVVTGFRVGLGGAQGYAGVRPDLTTFGKIIGGGLPIGALGGPRQLMQRLAPEGDVFHGGTFAGHPLSMTAGIATVQGLKTDPPYERLERLSGRLAEGLLKSASRSDVAIQINRLGSMLSVFFSETTVRDFEQAKASRRDRFAQWAQSLRRRGILIPPSPLEALFLSTAHTSAHVDRMVDASRTAFQSLKKKRFR
ncbi:MAG: aminotransferase class III-fold pyridoxal phosphate-dependent enzyme, partial [Candidatus Omnitrophica bacterium]|nr:aminotransferase class III-fold pyridoxal phosphate-dependent enzyme [Candidatus Omnitrophota bacterium]